MRRFSVAVVGCGAIAQAQHIANIAASDRMMLHTCCDISDETLAVCRDQFKAQHTTRDFHEVANDPEVDVICLATHENLRLPVIEAAAKAGKPIYVEKPVAPSMTEARAIQTIVNESGIPFCVGHNRRNSPAMIDARRLFRGHVENPQPCAWRWDRNPDDRPKELEGDAPSMAVRINDDWWSWKGWVFDSDEQVFGPMLFEMTHFTDLCNWFLASEPVEVVALETGMLNHGVVIAYENGSIATIHMGSTGTFGYPKELYEMMGNGGVVAVDQMLEVRTAGIEGAPPRTTYAMLKDRHPDVGVEGGLPGWLAKKRAACAEAAQQGDPMLQFTAEPDKGHAHALSRFLDEIEGTGPVVCGVDDAVLATRVAFAAILAAQHRRAVRLDEV